MPGESEWIDDLSRGRIDEYMAALFKADPTVQHPWVIVHWQRPAGGYCGVHVISNIGSHVDIVLQMLLSGFMHVSGADVECSLYHVTPEIGRDDGQPGGHRER